MQGGEHATLLPQSNLKFAVHSSHPLYGAGPYQWCSGLSVASSIESLWFRSKSTACSSMKGLCAANVITLTTFPRVSQRTIWRTGEFTTPRKHNPEAGEAHQRCSRNVARFVSVKPCTSGKHVHNFLPASTSKPHMRRWLLWELRRAAAPLGCFRRFAHRAAQLRRKLNAVFWFIQIA